MLLKMQRSKERVPLSIQTIITYFKNDAGCGALCIANIRAIAVYEDEWYWRKNLEDPWEACKAEDIRGKGFVPDMTQQRVMARLTNR